MDLEFVHGQLSVDVSLTCDGTRTRTFNSRSNHCCRFTSYCVDQRGGRRGFDGHSQIETIEKRATESALIPTNIGVAARARTWSRIGTRTRIGGGNEQELGRHCDTVSSTCNVHDAVFQRLSKCIEHGRWKLAEFIEKQHAV